MGPILAAAFDPFIFLATPVPFHPRARASQPRLGYGSSLSVPILHLYMYIRAVVPCAVELYYRCRHSLVVLTYSPLNSHARRYCMYLMPPITRSGTGTTLQRRVSTARVGEYNRDIRYTTTGAVQCSALESVAWTLGRQPIQGYPGKTVNHCSALSRFACRKPANGLSPAQATVLRNLSGILQN